MGVAIEQLKKEHAAIETMLKILDAVCGRLQAGEKIDPAHLTEIVEFFRGFADRCHHAKEEEILFPALEKVGIPKAGGPIGVMLYEHDQMRGYVKGLAEAVDRYGAGEVARRGEIIRHASEYAATLRRHIEKENQILFRLAEMRLGPDKEQELAERFEVMEVEKIGAGTHEPLHALLERLEGTYLRL
jgi:hemerythrin-like domain-containing protein